MQQRVTRARLHLNCLGRVALSSGVIAAVAVAAGLVAAAGATAAAEPAPLVGASSPGVIPGEYVVVLKDQAGLRASGLGTASGLRASGLGSTSGVGTASGRERSASAELVADAVSRTRKTGGRVTEQYTHALQGYGADLDARQLAQVRTDPAVAYVQANQRYRTTAVEKDAPWGLDRIDQRSLPLKDSYTYTETGLGVTAYVVDTGIRSTHLDFTTDPAGNSVPTRVVGGISKIKDDDGTADCLGHGTHVAGTIGGDHYGVAKQVTLVPVRVLDCNGVSSSKIVAQGLDWIVEAHTTGPAVANLSLTNEGGADLVVEAAVNRLIADGVTTVIAAGNGVYNKTIDDYKGVGACGVSPSRVRAAITVAATTRTDRRAGFSNYGSCVDLYAPGVDIESDSYLGDDLVVTMSGTSMATPHVAGAAALYLQAHPTATPAQVQAALIAASTPNKVTNVSSNWPRRLLFSLPKVDAPPATTTAGAVTTGTALLRGARICSPNGLYCLTQRASDGKLVLTRPGSRVLWTSNRAAAWTTVDASGNFVSYDGYGQWIWSSRTHTGPSTLRVTDLGNLVLTDNATGAVAWTSNAAQKPAPTQATNAVATLSTSKALYRDGAVLRSANGTFTLAVQAGGDLVLAKKKATIWHSGARNGDWLTLLPSGDLVYLRSNGTTVWRTDTGGQGAARLTLRDSGNLVLVRLSDQEILWSTRTSGA